MQVHCHSGVACCRVDRSVVRITRHLARPSWVEAACHAQVRQAWRTTASFAVKEGTETKGRLADYVILNGPVPVADEVGASCTDDIV